MASAMLIRVLKATVRGRVSRFFGELIGLSSEQTRERQPAARFPLRFDRP